MTFNIGDKVRRKRVENICICKNIGWCDPTGKPYFHFEIKEAGGWRIGMGVGSYLVAEGSRFSRNVGMSLLKSLRSGIIRP